MNSLSMIDHGHSVPARPQACIDRGHHWPILRRTGTINGRVFRRIRPSAHDRATLALLSLRVLVAAARPSTTLLRMDAGNCLMLCQDDGLRPARAIPFSRGAERSGLRASLGSCSGWPCSARLHSMASGWGWAARARACPAPGGAMRRRAVLSRKRGPAGPRPWTGMTACKAFSGNPASLYCPRPTSCSMRAIMYSRGTMVSASMYSSRAW